VSIAGQPAGESVELVTAQQQTARAKLGGLLAVERVPHRQLAHPVLEQQSDAIVLRRRALGQAM
jgi:hypothetical protein